MKTSIKLKGSRIAVASAYNPVFVERFRQIEGRKFDGDTKDWTFPATADALKAVCDVCGVLPFMLPLDLRGLLQEQMANVPRAKPVDISVINGHQFLTPPFEHQRIGLARLLDNDRWLTADEMGCGKSHIVCNRLKALFEHDVSEGEPNVLILCPKSVVQGWREQLMKHAGLFGAMVQGNAKDRKWIIEEPDGIKIANYELLLHSDFSVIDWDVIVLDEIHRCKSHTAQTSKKVRGLTAKAKYVWGLSGTPAPNGLEDWFGVLGAVNPELLPVKTKTAFEARYCIKREIQPGVWKVSGYRNVEELHGFIQSITSRVTKDEVLADLPPKTFVSRRVTMDDEQARVYRELKKDAVARLSKLKDLGELTIKNVLTESLRLLQVVGGHMPTDDGAIHEFDKKCKLPALAEVLEEMGDRQAVVWCCFRDEVEMLRRWLEKQGYTVSTLVGGMSDNERSENLEAFRRGDCQIHVGTSAAGGTGINQLVGADTCIYYSRSFNLTDYLQSQDRCHRIGTVSPVTIIKLVASGTIDEKVDASLDQKKDVMEMMLTDPGSAF